MITAKKTTIDTDYHSHILPYMDDGAANTETSLAMLAALRDQGINTVAATPHFDITKESAADFNVRRDASFTSLTEKLSEDMPRIVCGAEVLLSRGISKNDLRSLCYGESDYILVEFPRLPFAGWIISELEVMVYTQKLIPVIAHIDRYMEWYSKKEIYEMLSFDDALFQINNHAFQNKMVASRVKEIAEAGYPLLLGSDTHDMGIRRPNFDLAEKALTSFSMKRKVLAHIESTHRSVQI